MFSITQSTEIEHRSEFSLLCNWRRLHRAVEVGVDRGDFAVEFLSKWDGHTMLCIDPYVPYDEMNWDRDPEYRVALQRLTAFAHKVKLLREKSPEITAVLRRLGIGAWRGRDWDFVYLDGAHDFASVAADIAVWWPMVSRYGILAGHDFDQDHPGVMRAVEEFARGHDLRVQITQEFNPSWYIYRSEPSPDWKRVVP